MEERGDAVLMTARHDRSASRSDVAALVAEVESRFGRCLLRLQRCEHLAKHIVAHSAVTGPVVSLSTIQRERVERVAKKTLGGIAGDLFQSFVVPAGAACVAPVMPDDVLSLGFSTRIELPVDEYVRVVAEKDALVELRNDLAHHFLSKHHLASSDGCRAACEALIEAEARIDVFWARMKAWAEWNDEALRAAAELFASEEFRDQLVNGLSPDGTVYWPWAGCVSALREAAEALAVDGWTPLDAAVAWMAKNRPEQTPAKYGCRRWRQVLRKSGLFDVEHRIAQDGNFQFCFRPLAS